MDNSDEIIQEIGEGDFDAFLKDNPVVLVDFWAPWCVPCRIQGRMIKHSLMDLPEGVKVAKVNVDMNPDVASRYGVRGIPQMYLMVRGQPVKGWTGVTPVETLIREMSRHIPK